MLAHHTDRKQVYIKKHEGIVREFELSNPVSRLKDFKIATTLNPSVTVKEYEPQRSGSLWEHFVNT